MPDSLLYMFLQFVFMIIGVFSSGTLATIAWVLFGITTIWAGLRYYSRIRSPWCRLHYPLLIRYASFAGKYAAISQSEGAPFDVYSALSELIKFTYPDFTEEETKSFVKEAESKMTSFADRDVLQKFLSGKQPSSTNTDKVNSVLDDINDSLQDKKHFNANLVRFVVADVVERECGADERAKYIVELVRGNAN